MTRLAPDQIDEAKRTNLVALVRRYVPLRLRGGWWEGLCPFHKEKTPSFKIRDDRFCCFGCGARGDAIEFLRLIEKLDFQETVKRLVGGDFPAPKLRVVARNRHPETTVSADASLKARAIWSSARDPIDLLQPYFDARQLPWPPPPTIRALADFFVPPNSTWPAMVAAVQAPSGDIIGCQTTVLSISRDRKALTDARRTHGLLAAGAVRLAKAGEVIGLAEGVETGISAMALSGVPVWCCLGAARMHSVFIPDTVRELHIFGDDDGPGRDAAERTASLHGRCRRVVIRMPPEGFGDCNDVAQAKTRASK